MKTARKIIIVLWAIVALVGMVIGKMDVAIFSILWAIFMELEIISEK